MKSGVHRLPVILLAGVAMTNACRPQADGDAYTHLKGEIFATHYRISYRSGPAGEKVQAAVDKELQRIDWIASTWKPDSELMRYNRAEDKEAFELSPDLAWLLHHSAEIEALTGGAFSIRINPDQLDLSAIAKGYAVDKITALLTETFGIDSYMVDIGGEVKVHGKGPKGEHWHIGLYAPRPSGGPAIDPPILKLRDTSIATSGTYFKGKHLIDPRSGRPVAHDLISASVIHPSNTTADALATALYVMGPDKGLAWAKEQNIHAIFLLNNGQMEQHQP